MFIGIGITIHPDNSVLGLGGGVSLLAPFATWVSGPDVAQAIFAIDTPPGTTVGMWIRGRAYSDAGLTSLIEENSLEIESPDFDDFQIDDFAFAAFSDGTVYVVFDIIDAEHTGSFNILSATSDVISETIAAGSAYVPTYPYLMFG